MPIVWLVDLTIALAPTTGSRGVDNVTYFHDIWNHLLASGFQYGILLSMGLLIKVSDRLLRYVLIFEYQILVLDLVVNIRTKIS